MAAPISTTYPVEEKQRVIEHVLSEVSSGRSVSRVFTEDRQSENLPAESSFWRWHFADPELQEALGRARENGIEALLDGVIDIVDDATDDAYIEYAGQGENRTPVAKINGKAIRRASLQAEYRVKVAQMLKPRKYGAKLDVTSGGEKLEAGTTTNNDNRVQSIFAIAQQRKREEEEKLKRIMDE
jgi:hypothetical protein